jgi:nicotinamidase-related amidase
MNTVTYDKQATALLVIDPYNDFISEGGKVWDRLKGVAQANGCIPNMLKVLSAARAKGLRVFYAMHHRYRPGDYETWKYVAGPSSSAAGAARSAASSLLCRARSLHRNTGARAALRIQISICNSRSTASTK